MPARPTLGLLLALLLLPSTCLAFSTPDVDPRDPAYCDLDKLVAAGLIQEVIYGQRPWSRMEIARMVAEAQENFALRREEGRLQGPLAGTMGRLLERLKRRFRQELAALGPDREPPPPVSVHPVEELRLAYEYTNSPPGHFAPRDNGFGGLDTARIQPFAYFSQGQPLKPGHQFVAETVSTLRLSPYLSVLVEPRFYVQSAYDLDLLQAYGRLALGNASLSVGRKTVVWGQGEFAGALLSSNAWPLDLVMLSNEQPRLLPSFLRYLGPTKATFFYSDLGGTYQTHPGAYLVGLKLSIEPHPNFEFGISNLDISGGRNAPEAGLGERVRDVFSFDTNQPISNRLGGFEGRLRLPSLRGATLYLELMFDDPNANLGVLFGDETAYLCGLYLPLVDAAGRLSLRAEYHRTGLRFYRHDEFPAVRRQDILGDPLGPQAQAGYLSAAYDLTPGLTLSGQLAAEFRGSDTFRLTDPDDFTKEVVREGPQETRYRALVGGRYDLLPEALRFEAALGYERVYNFNFEEGMNRSNYYLRFGLTYFPPFGLN